MSHFTKKVWFILVFQLALLLLVGCGKGDELVIEEAGDRKIITLDALSLNSAMEQCVALFNQKNPDYYVHKVDYNNDMTYEEFLDARALKIMTGRSADLLYLSSDFRVNEYVEKGVLEDLTPYIERDIEKDRYVEGVFNLFSLDNGVYAAPVDADVNLLLKKCETKSPYEDITFAQLCDLLEKKEPASLFDRPVKDTLWFLYLYFGVNVNDPEELATMIELAEKYQRKPDTGMVFEKDFLMVDFRMSNPNSMLGTYVTFGKLGEDISGVNAPIVTSSFFGISSSSEEKEGAWEFIRFMLQEECQEIISASFMPVRKETFMSKCEEEYADELRRQYLEEQGVSMDHFIRNYNEMIQRGKPRELMAENYDILKIVWEEAAKYYDGEKDLASTIDVIRNRISLYQKENDM
ncbi:MAG: ABC transporter substrate-binding protein [Acetatifactor sp.]